MSLKKELVTDNRDQGRSHAFDILIIFDHFFFSVGGLDPSFTLV